MDNNETNCIKYRAQSARHGIEFLAVGGIGLIFIMGVNLLRPGDITLVEIFLVSACIGGVFIGFLKTQEPFYSLILTEYSLIYIHKYGNWELFHKNFHHCGIPKITHGLEYKELNAIGIRLNNIDEFLSDITPRMAGKLLIEQRHLFMQVVKNHCNKGNCPSNWLVEDTQYRSPDGISYNGLIAMFANRTKNFQLLTGYDLLLPASALDRDIWAFSADLNKWKREPSQFLASQLEN